MKITVEQIRKLRESTGAPVIRVKKVLEEVGGDEKKAFVILQKEGFEKAAKRSDKLTSAGMVAVYLHHTKKVVGVAELFSETDFVSRNELFVKVANDIAMQVASMNPKSTEDLLDQEFIKDPSKKIAQLVKELIAKTGENIRVGKIYRIELGK